MESCLKFIPSKSYNKAGFLFLALFVSIGVVLIGIASDFESKATLQCNPDKTLASDLSTRKYIETQCFFKYAQEFYPSMSLRSQFMLNFGLVILLSIIYAYLVKDQVETFANPASGTTVTNDRENESQPLSGISKAASDPIAHQNSGDHFVFRCYIMHLILCRIVPLVVFAVFLLTSSNFPVQFPCRWPINQPTAMSTAKANFTQSPTSKHSVVDCTYSMGNRNEKIAVTVATVNFLSAAFAFVELSYLLYSAWKDDNLLTDLEFCCVYILRKRKRIRKIIRQIKENMSTEIFYLHDDFGEKQLSRRRLEEMYVNVMVREGRESTPNSARGLEGSRHSIYEAHLEALEDSTTLTEMADLFKPIGVCKTYPRTILVVGRPGIGKTVLTKRIMSQWQQQEFGFWHNKIVILVRFFSFNKAKGRSNLVEMLRCSAGFNMSSADFNAICEYVFLMPSKVVLILDGLDELVVDESFTEERVVNCHNEVTHMRLIFEQLVKGELLPGVTVLSTSRPTAEEIYKNVKFDREVEILGFKKDQIKDYVDKFFCGNMEKGSEIWNLIESSPEYLSLCYVPVNSYIVCLTLNESIEAGGKDNAPRTITELYKRAIKILLYRHHLRYKGKSIPKDYLIAKLPEDLQNDLNKLKKIARDGMMTDQLVFEFQSDDAFFADLDDCGLFNKLEDKQQNIFCFLHLTIQEFLAAQHVVDDISNVEGFIGYFNDTKLFLVIQFVAGLIGDKIRELKDERNRLERSNTLQNTEKTHELTRNEEIVNSICQRFQRWIPKTGIIGDYFTLFAIKCLGELQEVSVMEFDATKEFDGGEIFLRDLNIAPVESIALFKFISCIKNLHKLQMNSCWMEHLAFRELVSLLENENCQLTELNIMSNHFDDDVVVKTLSDALQSGNCKLTKLDVSVGNNGVTYLSDALKSENCKLTRLNIDGIITEADAAVVCLSDALKNDNCKLTKLKVRDHILTDAAAKCLSSALKSDNCKLSVLDIRRKELTDLGIKYLIGALENDNCKLTKLHISSLYLDDITDLGLKCLSNYLKRDNSKLSVLYIPRNQFTNEGVKYLSDALKTDNCKLAKLNISHCYELTDEGVEYLSDALKSENCKLTELDISKNMITYIGSIFLNDALTSDNCSLTKLNARANELTDIGAKCLSDALKSDKCKLAVLDISCNKLTDEGAKYLADALKSENCKLTKLNICQNKLTDVSVGYLSDAQRSENCKLTELNISMNSITCVSEYFPPSLKLIY